MRQPPSLIRAVALLGALAGPFCWPPQRAEAQVATTDLKAGSIQGIVFVADQDGVRAVVPGATVSLKGSLLSQQTISDDSGGYSFRAVPPDAYQIEVVAPGLRGSSVVQVSAGNARDLPIELKAEAMQESVTVTADSPPVDLTEPSDQTVLDKATVVNAPNKLDRVDALLPLVPGVVRGPDGLINMKGARSSQGGYLVNSASAIDPVTGNAAISLPIDVVESVKVIADPYDPEYGRLTGAVASVETVTGNFNAFHLSVQNLFARPRKRDNDFVGIESFTPRLTFSGPIVKNKIAFTQSFEYRFVRTPVESLPPLQRDIKFEGFNSFSQVDVNLTPRQTMTASLAVYPQKINYLGLNTFVPQPSTPDLHQRGYMADIQHRYTLSPTFDLRFAIQLQTLRCRRDCE